MIVSFSIINEQQQKDIKINRIVPDLICPIFLYQHCSGSVEPFLKAPKAFYFILCSNLFLLYQNYFQDLKTI